MTQWVQHEEIWGPGLKSLGGRDPEDSGRALSQTFRVFFGKQATGMLLAGSSSTCTQRPQRLSMSCGEDFPRDSPVLSVKKLQMGETAT